MKKVKPYLIIMFPISLVVISFLFGLSYSFFKIMECSENYCGLSLFKNLMNDNNFLNSLLFSLKISFLSALLSTGFGLLFALFLFVLQFKSINYKYKQMHLLYKLPIIIPYSFVALIVIDFFSTTGVGAKVLFNLGLIKDSQDFPLLIFDYFGTGIIIAYVYKSTPFVALTIYSLLNSIDKTYINIAQSLGANAINLFKLLLFPKIKNQIAANFLIIFAFVFGSYEIPYLLGNAKIQALPLLMYNEYIKFPLEHKLNAYGINIIMSICGFCMLLLFMSINKNLKNTKYE